MCYCNMYITLYLLLIILDSIFNDVNPESHCHYKVISPDSEVSILYSTVFKPHFIYIIKERGTKQEAVL